MIKLQIHSSPEELIQTAANLFIKSGQSAIREKGIFSVALSGGSTPQPLYELLKSAPYLDSVDWNLIHFFWGDERTVPPDHPESNFFQANQILLEPLGINPENIHRIQGELEPVLAADNYQSEISSFFPSSPPRFDLILLGMGSDGHTASLFPKTKVVAHPEDYQLVAANHVPQLNTWRITFTPQLINRSARVIFLVSGDNKASPLHQVIEGPYKPDTYPSQLINPENGELLWLIDEAAAQRLTSY
jgi:6-phosphogluconolactonase